MNQDAKDLHQPQPPRLSFKLSSENSEEDIVSRGIFRLASGELRRLSESFGVCAILFERSSEVRT